MLLNSYARHRPRHENSAQTQKLAEQSWCAGRGAMYFHLIDLPLLGSKISAYPEQHHCREYQALDIPEVGGWKVASRKRLGSAEH